MYTYFQIYQVVYINYVQYFFCVCMCNNCTSLKLEEKRESAWRLSKDKIYYKKSLEELFIFILRERKKRSGSKQLP